MYIGKINKTVKSGYFIYILFLQEKQDVGVVWVDAHADLNTNKTSESGNVHGMPVALLTSELADYWPYLPGMDWQMPM